MKNKGGRPRPGPAGDLKRNDLRPMKRYEVKNRYCAFNVRAINPDWPPPKLDGK
jgi:hypothetical protein